MSRRNTIVRVLLIALAAPSVLIGAWALFAPASWFDSFPGLGRTWTAALPPFNEHLARDVGAFYLAMGALFTWAAVRLGRDLVRAATVTSLLFAVPHLVFHAGNLEGLSTSDAVAQIGALLMTVVGAIAAAVLVEPSPGGDG